MKIAINTRFLMPNQLEGIGWFTHEVVKRWVQWYPEHEFIFIFDRTFSEEFIFGDNVKGIATFPPARHPVLFYWWYEYTIPKLLKKEKVDVFVSPDGFASLKTTVPSLMVLHDIAWKHFPNYVYYTAQKFYEHYVPKYCQKVNQIATVSNYSKEDIVKSFGIAPQKIDVVYNGKHTSYQPLSAAKKQSIREEYAEGNPYFLYVGSIHPRKNVANLLRAFEQFKQKTNSKLKLLLGGRMAWQTGKIGDLLPTLHFREDIVFLGYVSNEALPNLIGAAYAMTYVSLFEGFGVPLLEAIACNVPCITSNTSSMPEVVGNAGLLVDPNDVTDITNQMKTIWQDQQVYQQLVSNCAPQANKFSWDLTAQKLWQSLEKCIAK